MSRLPFPFDIDFTPAYSKPGELLYDIKQDEQSKPDKHYSVFKKGDTSEELLRFRYIGHDKYGVLRDFPERYLPEKNRTPKVLAEEKDGK